MATTLLLAPAASGKTAHAIARIRDARAGRTQGGRPHPTGGLRPGSPLQAPIVVVLPNTLQLAAFRRRLAAQGGALGVSLFTFYGLYAELLARVGRPLPLLDSATQTRLIRAVVDDLGGRGLLTYFAPLRDKPGLAAALREAFEELKRARIQQED
ncbi:MAG: hypothetical protein AAB217_10205, partial [Chloroflexota bacterium]